MYFSKEQQIATLYMQDIYIALAYIFHHQNIMKALTISNEKERYAKINECHLVINAIEEEIRERFKALTVHFNVSSIDEYENAKSYENILAMLEKYFDASQMDLVEKVLKSAEGYTERKYEKRQQELESLRQSLISTLLEDELEEEAEILLIKTNDALKNQRWMHPSSSLRSELSQPFKSALEKQTQQIAGTLIKQYGSFLKQWIETQIEYNQMIKTRPFWVGFNAQLNLIYKILDPNSHIADDEKYRLIRQCLKHYAREPDCYGYTIIDDVLSDIEGSESEDKQKVTDIESLSNVLDIIYQARDRHNTQGIKAAHFQQSIQITSFAAQLDQIRTASLIETKTPVFQAESLNYKILRVKTVYQDILNACLQTGEALRSLGFPEDGLETLQSAYTKMNSADEGSKNESVIKYNKALATYLSKALSPLEALQIDTDHVEKSRLPTLLKEHSEKLTSFIDELEKSNKARQKVSPPSFLSYQLAANKKQTYRLMYAGLFITAGVFVFMFKDRLQSGLSTAAQSLSTLKYHMPSTSDAKGIASYAAGTLGATIMKQAAEPVVSYTFSVAKRALSSTSSESGTYASHSARFYTAPIERKERTSRDAIDPKSDDNSPSSSH